MGAAEWQTDVHIRAHLPQDATSTFDLCTPGQCGLCVRNEDLNLIFVDSTKIAAICLGKGERERGREYQKDGRRREGGREGGREREGISKGQKEEGGREGDSPQGPLRTSWAHSPSSTS